MKKLIKIFLITLFCSFSNAQSKKNWTVLDFLNFSAENPFIVENDINGVCFVILSEEFNYYKSPIIINNENQNVILNIEYNETVGFLTTYKNKIYSKNENLLNPFKPWFWSENPDYFNFVLECVDTIGNYYKVKLNNVDFGWINKSDTNFKRQKIDEFVLEYTADPMGLDFDRRNNPLRKEPDEKSEIIFHTEEKKYKIWRATTLEIKNEWLRIETIKKEIGWLKWKEGNKILIRMYYSL
ncbi:MAG: hypothetical protein KGZ81_08805 [Flavobacteriales bacterium]|nr:hypothetical protein [Flavobacteriales bacterium]